MPAPYDERYQLPSWPPTTFNLDLWNAVFGSIADRLTAREALEASFEALIAEGTQASLDYIQATIAPQIASLQETITLAQDQIDQIVNDGIAPDSSKLGGQLPAYYATAAALTSGLSGKVSTSLTINDKPLTANVTLAKGDIGLGNVDNTPDANKPVSAPQQAALDKRAQQNDPRRDRAVNGALQHSQENGDTGATTDGYYFADQWKVQSAGSNVATKATAKREAHVFPNGGRYCGKLTVNTAVATLAANDQVFFLQPFEAVDFEDLMWGTADAVDLVVHVSVNLPAGTYSASITNHNTTRSYVQNFTIAAGEAGTNKELEFVFPGDTGGTWQTGAVLWGSLCITIAAGSNFQASPDVWQAGFYHATASNTNGMATASAVFKIGEVGIKADFEGTGVYGTYEVPDWERELSKSKRYCQWARKGVGRASASTAGYIHTECSPPMRTGPTCTLKSGTLAIDEVSVGSHDVGAIGANIATSDGVFISFTTSGIGTGTPVVWRHDQNSVFLSARM